MCYKLISSNIFSYLVQMSCLESLPHYWNDLTMGKNALDADCGAFDINDFA